jgi:K+-transporting ATPase ATPase A chain
MEGKEVRFGVANSALYATVTTDASCGAVNSWHDSFTPLGGLVPLFNIEMGELVYGGVGAGLYAMLIIAILSVFIAGLMVGRTPEYLGKKIEPASEARDAVRARVPARDPRLRRLVGGGAYGVSSMANAGPTASARSSTRSPARRGTTVRPSRGSAPTPPGTTSRSA